MREFCNSIENFIEDLDSISGELRLTSNKIFLGVPNDTVMNLLIFIAKSMIAKQCHLSINQFVLRLKIEVMNEKCMAKTSKRLEKYEEVWVRKKCGYGRSVVRN